MSRFAVVALLCLTSLSLCWADVPGDLIDTLPGYGKTPSKQYSGFLPVDEAKTVFLHYWFVTSTREPSIDPLTVWMNGGPGCSSLEGFLTELGPFKFTGERDSTGLPLLTDNLSAWTTVSSLLFIEQPAGVGFSYAVNGSTWTDDFIQSQNTYGFLLNFFKVYPEYRKQDFHIAGESYAGIYVPTLANRILDGNAAGQPRINLKGIAVGNGCMGVDTAYCGVYLGAGFAQHTKFDIDFMYGHALVSSQAYAAVYAACGDFHNLTAACQSALDHALTRVGPINYKNVYDVCDNDYGYRPMALSASSSRLRAPSSLFDGIEDPVECIPTVLSNDYMSSDIVKKAIHVDQANVSQWGQCYDILYDQVLPSVLPLYPKLISNMNVLIYNGDADDSLPWNGGYYWTRNLGLAETVAWRSWKTQGDGRSWVGGFVTGFGANFTFLTVKHAGHMVPQFEPEAALTFYTAFLKHQLPK